ncbi:hypothetical protein L210DRAFT_3521963 [Boletus edulis BED1]|uniref:Uncharacterized protein n=1 Tax=Boletus edulis BED1 TaxID=1328754 RepID=A0AAD4GMG2_BOLED|nr:hypothetical protein L210DRAFT_3521963 [Boletus edulis BED1]
MPLRDIHRPVDILIIIPLLVGSRVKPRESLKSRPIFNSTQLQAGRRTSQQCGRISRHPPYAWREDLRGTISQCRDVYIKALPPAPFTPTPARVDTTYLTPSTKLRENQPQTPSVAISRASPSMANAENKSSKSIKTATGSTGSGSSRHRKGLSVDKFGLAKYLEQTATNGMWSRVPSESSAAGTPAAEEKKAPPTVPSTNDVNKNALLSPLYPLHQCIRSQKGKPPVSETPVKDNCDLGKQLPPSSTASPSLTNRPVEPTPSGVGEPIYGDTAQDAGDGVRFSIEVTQIDRLKDTYSLDIRR